MNNKTKKNIKIILILLVVLICGALAIYGAIIGLFSYLDSTVEPTKSELLLTSMGEFTTEEHYRYGWWQDGGTYSKYTYKSADLNNEYLSQITESDIEEIEHNISEFEFWVSSSKTSEDDKTLYENYDFDVSIIDTNDYWFVEYDETDERDFDLFIFDTETTVLYGFSYSI
jgi:uncharacterized protein YxeA